MQPRPFQIHFSQKYYNELYDETDRRWFDCNDDKKEIYSLKQKGVQNKTFVAKKYTYKKNKFINNVWEELNSIIKMRDHDHPNVIKYHDVFMYDITQKNKNYQVCIMVMEKGDCTLEEFVTNTIQKDRKYKQEELKRQQQQYEEQTSKKNQKTYQQFQQQYENLVYTYLKQTLNGCKFLKSKNIYHRDYKPMNLVLLNNEIKIIDFDIAKITQLDITQQMSSVSGTEIYMDPSLIQIKKQIGLEDEDPEIRYNLEKMDIYSIGCTFLKLAMKWNGPSYVIYTMQTKNFYESLQYQEQEAHLQQVTSSIEHQKLKYILCKMLILDLKKRWNLEECIQEKEMQQAQQLLQSQNQQRQQQQQHQIQEQQQIVIQEQGNNNLEPLTQEQLEEINKEKYTIQILKDLNYLENDNKKTRYIVIEQNQYLKNYEQQINQISNFINNQHKLIKLDIIWYYYSEEILNLFPKITNKQNIQQLHLEIGGANQIGQNGANNIAIALQQLTTLQQLHLEIGVGNIIGENGANSIGAALQQLTTLQQLHLEIGVGNDIGENGAKSIGAGLQQLTTLQQLHLEIGNCNYIGENGAKSIAAALQQLNTLQQLHLEIGDCNDIGENGAKSIAAALQQLTTLQQLHLEIGDENIIGENGAKSIESAVLELPNLNNQIYLFLQGIQYQDKQQLRQQLF